MIITLNGERREVPEALTVAGLLGHLGVKPEHVAVEVNRAARHARPGMPRRAVAPGDVLEVVTLVGGGAAGGGRRNRTL